jgi:hypothetical protein
MSDFLASIDAEIVEMLRAAAKEVFGANCSFADDDLLLLKVCAKWAIQNGIPDELNTEIIPRAKALHGGDPEWWHKGRPDKSKGVTKVIGR